jgi:formylglycine-generating enzyme required for sulfatase activity
MLITLYLFSCSNDSSQFDDMVKFELTDGHVYFIDKYEFPNKKNKMPEAKLSLEKAIALCKTVGKRLCTSREWRNACQDGKQKRYVYGDKYRPGHCLSNTDIPQGHTSLIHEEQEYAPSGSNVNCVTDKGIFDMNGNLEEWVLDNWKGFGGILEGGAWYSHHQYADCTGRYSRQPDYRLTPDRHTDSAGVRCCWSEVPPSPEQIDQDAITRLKTAQQKSSTAKYNPEDEVLLSEDIWIDRYEYPNIKGEYPLTVVNWYEAKEKCTEVGKRLCSLKEWEQACVGQSESAYPYGKRHIKGRCIDGLDSQLPSGTFSNCKSKSGAIDMTGSVWEWTSSDLTINELQTNENQQLKEVRGGSWFSDSLKASCKPSVGYPTAPSTMRFPDVGFRCCRGTRSSSTAYTSSFSADCPENMRSISKGCIDQFEYPNRKGEIPLADINHSEAIALCKEQGKHLCTGVEWLEACEGRNNKRRWSYGNQYKTHRCNHNADAKNGIPLESGSFSNCQTPNLVYDLTGNLWEWTNDEKIRGGNWNFSEGLGQCQSIATPDPTKQSRTIGFRCCVTQSEKAALLKLEGLKQ